MAHRGLHDPGAGIIENTPAAFVAAIAGNYGIECDLQISADGEAMVHHDDVLGRLTEGDGRLDHITAAELKRVRFRSTTDRMMTLARAGRAGGRPQHAGDRAQEPLRRRPQTGGEGGSRPRGLPRTGCGHVVRSPTRSLICARSRPPSHAASSPRAITGTTSGISCRCLASARWLASHMRPAPGRNSSPIPCETCPPRSPGWHAGCSVCRC